MHLLAELFAKPGFRKAVTNFGWLSFDRAGRFVFSALVGLLVTRYLGPARLGSLSYCLAVVTLVGFVPSLGLDAVVKRELLRSAATEAEVLASTFFARLAAGALAWGVILAVSIAGWGFTAEESRLVVILGLILFQPALFLPELWLQSHLHAKWAVAMQLGALAVASAVRLWLIHAGASLTAFAWVIIGELALGMLGFYLGAKRLGMAFALAAARLATIRRLVGEAWPLMFANFAIYIYMKIDEVMLRQFVGASAVGIYAAAEKISEVWYFIPLALASSVLPALLRAQKNDAAEYAQRQQQYYDLSAAVAYGLSIPIALLSPWLVRLAFGAEFTAAGPILAVHIWSSIFVFLGVARGQWLVNEGLQRFYLAATCAGAVANIALNLVFIPRWSGLGAAWATVASQAIAAWLATYFHPVARATAVMQTRALLIPFRGWRYLRRA